MLKAVRRFVINRSTTSFQRELVRNSFFILTGLAVVVVSPAASYGITRTCNGSYSDCNSKLSASSAGDVIQIADGTFTWTTGLSINKAVTVQGGGIGGTTIKTAGIAAVYVLSSNARVTGITFDCQWANTDNPGMLSVGKSDTRGCMDPASYAYSDWRIDHNQFLHCGRSSGSVLGYRAIGTYGPTYGLIDNNVFDDCNGECISLEQDGALSRTRSNEPGQYGANKTIYVENNTFNYTSTYSHDVDNAIDANSGARYVFRYNTLNIGNGAWVAEMASTHDCSNGQNCDGGTQRDANPQMVEVYGNRIYLTGTGGMGGFFAQRSGRAFVYNNTVYYKDISHAVRAYHLRSEHRPNCMPSHLEGLSTYCHEYEAGYESEGLKYQKTTLNGALGNDTGCPTMASVSGFPSVGSIQIGTEQIDYTGISGNTLAPCTRGANRANGAGARASHSDGSKVNLFIWGNCLDGLSSNYGKNNPNNSSWYWGNLYKATLESIGSARNNVTILEPTSDGVTPTYISYDFQSYSQRPSNWQYRNDGTAYPNAPYPYPHPLRGGMSEPKNLRIMQ